MIHTTDTYESKVTLEGTIVSFANQYAATNDTVERNAIDGRVEKFLSLTDVSPAEAKKLYGHYTFLRDEAVKAHTWQRSGRRDSSRLQKVDTQ